MLFLGGPALHGANAKGTLTQQQYTYTIHFKVVEGEERKRFDKHRSMELIAYLSISGIRE
jgi:hypothetical protein